ncbi:MAG: roadblock/LC7 domain-containing protein [candidate division Zixibacteria bacterium]|nr:roadblock/LC7 domain-containing protein [candidate division Zixibacteria bacterium]MBU1471700.1 roadblock/LC7 domain-containing protein [candidate division Zixibacteria bacterium]MBU2625404.1 roadblock/LC7 domain-containing protein [candidate division Zixibacteria bacterium]
MYDVLEDINRTSGVTGSMVVGHDGIVIAADLDARFQDETVGAIAASITANVNKSLERLSDEELSQITIEAANGKLFMSSNETGILVVTADPEVNIGLIRLEMKHAMSRIKTV